MARHIWRLEGLVPHASMGRPSFWRFASVFSDSVMRGLDEKLIIDSNGTLLMAHCHFFA